MNNKPLYSIKANSCQCFAHLASFLILVYQTYYRRLLQYTYVTDVCLFVCFACLGFCFDAPHTLFLSSSSISILSQYLYSISSPATFTHTCRHTHRDRARETRVSPIRLPAVICHQSHHSVVCLLDNVVQRRHSASQGIPFITPAGGRVVMQTCFIIKHIFKSL